jgi:hypothetical protein
MTARHAFHRQDKFPSLRFNKIDTSGSQNLDQDGNRVNSGFELSGSPEQTE